MLQFALLCCLRLHLLPTCMSRSGSSELIQNMLPASAGPGHAGTEESMLKSHCVPPSSFAFQTHVISETRVFLSRKTHPQDHEVTVVGWDHSRLLVLGFSSSCQGFAPNNPYSLCTCEDNTAARNCCSVLISSGSGIQTHPALCCRDMSLPAGNMLKKKPFHHYFFLLLSSPYLFSPQYCKLTCMLGAITSFSCR